MSDAPVNRSSMESFSSQPSPRPRGMGSIAEEAEGGGADAYNPSLYQDPEDVDPETLKNRYAEAERDYHNRLQKVSAMRRAIDQLEAALKEHEQAKAGASAEDAAKHQKEIDQIVLRLEQAEPALRAETDAKQRAEDARRRLKLKLDRQHVDYK